MGSEEEEQGIKLMFLEAGEFFFFCLPASHESWQTNSEGDFCLQFTARVRKKPQFPLEYSWE